MMNESARLADALRKRHELADGSEDFWQYSNRMLGEYRRERGILFGTPPSDAEFADMRSWLADQT